METTILSNALTTIQAARRLGVDAGKVRDLILHGHLEAFSVSLGKRAKWRILPEKLEAFITARSSRPAPRVTRIRRQPAGAAPSRY